MVRNIAASQLTPPASFFSFVFLPYIRIYSSSGSTENNCAMWNWIDTMHEFLLKRNVHQRIFTRLVKTINLLLQNESSSTKIIGKRLDELNDRWISLQESHDSYISSCFSDPHDRDEQDKYINVGTNSILSNPIARSLSIAKTTLDTATINHLKMP